MDVYKRLHYNVVPPVFICCFTSFAQVATLSWRGESITFENISKGILGNYFSWVFVCTVSLWALVWLWLPGRTTKGPASPEGKIPVYKDNGVPYYFASIGFYLIYEHFKPGFSNDVYNNAPEILGTLNIIAFVLCFYLFLSSDAQDEGLPKVYLFYRGRDLYPTIFGVQIKQLTNCRIGLILWQILPIAYFIASCRMNSFNFPTFVTLIIQSVYLYKFFTWEAGYFNTLDIILDRAGYYLCWGCLVWVPCFYVSSSYYLVKYPPQVSNLFSFVTLVLGLFLIYTQYRVDMEKMDFKADNNALIWGKPATYIKTEIVDKTGKKRNILTSGYWGLARHLNYTLEILIALSYSVQGYGLGFVPFLYPIFLTYLLVHRIFRDEEKCRAQYGKYWDEYCTQVPYRLIPLLF